MSSETSALPPEEFEKFEQENRVFAKSLLGVGLCSVVIPSKLTSGTQLNFRVGVWCWDPLAKVARRGLTGTKKQL